MNSSNNFVTVYLGLLDIFPKKRVLHIYQAPSVNFIKGLFETEEMKCECFKMHRQLEMLQHHHCSERKWIKKVLKLVFKVCVFNNLKSGDRAHGQLCVSSHSCRVTCSFTAIQASIHLALYNIYFYKLGCSGGGTTNVTFHAEIAWQQSAKFILRVYMT